MNTIIKEDSILHRDMRIAKILAAVAFLTLSFAFLLEFFFAHNDFIINVLLGLSASSAIAFITVFLPAESKRVSEVREITDNCTNILMTYISIIQKIKLLRDPSIIKICMPTDPVLLNKIIKRADDLIKKIKTDTDNYRVGEIESAEVTILFERYNKELCSNLETIKGYLDTIISLAKSNDTAEKKEINARYLRLIDEYVEILLDFIGYSQLDDLEKAFKAAFPQKKNIESEFSWYSMEDNERTLDEISNAIEDIMEDLKRRKLYSVIQNKWDENRDHAFTSGGVS